MSTERLLLTEFQATDAAFVQALLNDPGWLKYIGQRQIQSQEAALDYIQTQLQPQYTQPGMGLFKMQRLSDGLSLGLCGLLQRESLPTPDLGFALLESFTGQGFAYEAAQKILQLADEDLKIKSLFAITQANNQASILLLQKLGFTFEREWQDLWRYKRLCRH